MSEKAAVIRPVRTAIVCVTYKKYVLAAFNRIRESKFVDKPKMLNCSRTRGLHMRSSRSNGSYTTVRYFSIICLRLNGYLLFVMLKLVSDGILKQQEPMSIYSKLKL